MLSLFLLACDSPVPTVSVTVPTPPPLRIGRFVDPLDAVIAEQEDYSYNPIGKPDPFRSLTCTSCGSAVKRRDYPLESFRLRGVIWGVGEPQALVEDPDGGSRVLKIGSYIGESWGKVTRITEGRVEVTEEYMTLDGDLIVMPRTLRMEG